MFSRTTAAKAFGRVLKRRRGEMSQTVLAHRAQLDATYPSLLERGSRCPTLFAFVELARALRIPERQLFDDFMKELEK